jgi:hypothetical protein
MTGTARAQDHVTLGAFGSSESAERPSEASAARPAEASAERSACSSSSSEAAEGRTSAQIDERLQDYLRFWKGKNLMVGVCVWCRSDLALVPLDPA